MEDQVKTESDQKTLGLEWTFQVNHWYLLDIIDITDDLSWNLYIFLHLRKEEVLLKISTVPCSETRYLPTFKK